MALLWTVHIKYNFLNNKFVYLICRNEDICDTLYALAYKGKVRPDKLNLGTYKIDVIANSIREVIEEKNDDK